jgi:hypothetical protein
MRRNSATKPKTTDALKIIDALYFDGRPAMQKMLREAVAKLKKEQSTKRPHAKA